MKPGWPAIHSAINPETVIHNVGIAREYLAKPTDPLGKPPVIGIQEANPSRAAAAYANVSWARWATGRFDPHKVDPKHPLPATNDTRQILGRAVITDDHSEISIMLST
jgi:hypothetical protein